MTDTARLLHQHSFIELGARQRAKALLNAGSFRELIDPFQRVMSPWLARQNVVPQADDGVIIAKGTLAGRPVVLAAIEGAFQGGSLGEVGGAKIAGALELAAQDNRDGIPTAAILLLETGGVRLQEANLGLAGGGRDRWQRRLLWWHVHRRWAVQPPDRHPRSAIGPQWPAGDRAGGGHCRIRFA
jgi:malonate decarboxylase beta subunit